MCLATDSKTADVGGGEMSCSDIAYPQFFVCPASHNRMCPNGGLADEVAVGNQVHDAILRDDTEGTTRIKSAA